MRVATLVAVAALLCGLTGGARASDASSGQPGESTLLRLEHVLESVDEHHPLVRAQLGMLEAARGEALQARGAYDPSLLVKGSVTPQGYYDYQEVDASIAQLTPWWGAELYAGYRVAGGNVPSYFGELETLDAGELRAGFSLPLWKDRGIDPARAGRERADAGSDGAAAMSEQVRLGLWFEATVAYYEWIAAAEGQRVHTELFELAQMRAEQIAGKVRSGALAPFAQLDNQRALLSRQAKLVAATRKLEQSTLKLSLFVRDHNGKPRRVEQGLAPDLHLPVLPAKSGAESAQLAALERHPALARYRALERQVRTDADLADNGVAPELDIMGEVSRDVGDGSDRAVERLGPTVIKVGAGLKVPFGLRQARGKRAAAEAKLAAVRAKLVLAGDKVRVGVLDAASALTRAIEREVQAREAARIAARLAAGERKRFDLGATTLVWVTMREKTAADAEIAAIRARVDACIAEAGYQIALAERPASRGGGS